MPDDGVCRFLELPCCVPDIYRGEHESNSSVRESAIEEVVKKIPEVLETRFQVEWLKMQLTALMSVTVGATV